MPLHSTSIHTFLGVEFFFLGVGLLGFGLLDYEIPPGPILFSCFGLLGLGVSYLGLLGRFGSDSASEPDFSTSEVPGGHLAPSQVSASIWLEGGRIAWANGSVITTLAWPESSSSIPAKHRAFFALLAASEIRGHLALQRIHVRRWHRGADESTARSEGYRDDAADDIWTEENADIRLNIASGDHGSRRDAGGESVSLSGAPVDPLLPELARRFSTARACLEAILSDRSLRDRVKVAVARASQGIDPKRLE